MTTLSTVTLIKQLRAALLTVPDAEGRTLGTTLGTVATGRLWLGNGPDNASYPHGTLRLYSQRYDAGGARLEATLEVMLFHRPRAKLSTLEGLADLAIGALLQYADGSSGLLRAQPRQRDTLPVVEEPADAEVCQIRLLFDVIAFPQQLTQYS